MSGPEHDEKSIDNGGKLSAPAVSPKPRGWGRRLKGVLWRLLFYTPFAVVLILALIVAIAQWTMTPDRLKSWLEKSAVQVIDGRLEIGEIHGDVLHGFSIRDMRIWPHHFVIPDDSELVQTPFFRCDEIILKYRLRKLLLGQVDVERLVIKKPVLSVVTFDGYSSIDHLFKSQPPESLVKAPMPEEKNEESTSGSSALAFFDPDLLYMPFKIYIQDLGLEGLSLRTLEKTSKGAIKDTEIKGFNLHLGLYWFKKTSRIWVHSLSTFDEPLAISVSQEDGLKKGQTSKRHLTAAWMFNIGLDNLKSLAIDIGLRIIKIAPQQFDLGEGGLLTNIRLDFDVPQRKLLVKNIFAEIIDILEWRVQGNVSVESLEPPKLAVDLTQNLHVDLSSVAQHLKAWWPQAALSGIVSLENQRAVGPLDLSFGKTLNWERIPRVSGQLSLTDVTVHLPPWGISMEALSGVIKSETSATLMTQGIAIDGALSLAWNNLALALSQQRGPPLNVVIGKTRIEGASRMIWPLGLVQLGRVNVATDLLSVAQGSQKVEAPLTLSVEGDGGQDLQKVTSRLDLEWTGLLEAALGVDCEKKCSRIRTMSEVRLPSLRQILASIRPFLKSSPFADELPEELSGRMSLRFDAQGVIPSPLEATQDQIFRDGDVRFHSALELANVGAHVPKARVKMKGLGVKVNAEGTLLEQEVGLQTRLAEVIYGSAPGGIAVGSDGQPKPTEISNISWDVVLGNQWPRGTNLAAILKESQTTLRSGLSIGSVRAPEWLEFPVRGTSFNFDVALTKLQTLSLKTLKLTSDEFGLSLASDGQLDLDADGKPSHIEMNTALGLDHRDRERVVKGVTTKGMAEVKVQMSSDGREKHLVSGEINLDQFKCRVGEEREGGDIPFEIVGMTGRFPFSQVITLNLADLSKGPGGSKKLQEREDVAAAKQGEIEKNDKSKEITSTVTQDNVLKAAEAYVAKLDKTRESSANVVSSADYQSMRGFYPSRQPIFIKSIRANKIVIQDLEFDLSFRQNILAINHYALSLLGGHVQGDVQVRFDTADLGPSLAKEGKPDILRIISANIHITRMDTRKIMDWIPKQKSDAGISADFFSSPFIDATVHGQFDLQSGDLNGNVELTTIGKEQLKMLLRYADPQEEDPTIGEIRKALKIGDVRLVSIPIKNGEIGLAVDIRALGIPIPTPKLSRFPISQLVKNLRGGEENRADKTGDPL